MDFQCFKEEELPFFTEKYEKKDSFFNDASKKKILFQIANTEHFEVFLHKKYPGQKRFSIEGCEILIPMLQAIFEKNLEALFIGMSHRGRLNVLANILEKPYVDIFSDFNETELDALKQGDVKYHKGYSAQVKKEGKEVLIVLSPNPSHLESVYPVVLGKLKAFQKNNPNKKSLGVVIHGDGSLAGQGVVYETLQLTSLKGYQTGGTLHICVDNQIAFTTSPENSRSTPFPTDIAKTFEYPVLHVEADNPEKALFSMHVALEYIEKFKKDIFIRLIGYRKYGHNEGDEPFFTHPVEYAKIAKTPPLYTQFLETLIKEKVLTEQEAIEKKEAFQKLLQEAFIEKKEKKKEAPLIKQPSSFMDPFMYPFMYPWESISKAYHSFPENFAIHPKLDVILQERKDTLKEETLKKIDFGAAESLALALILLNKKRVRFTGQDVIRGTFSHRHAAYFDQNTGVPFFPLSLLQEGFFECINTPLSEYASLGFEWGYATYMQEGITIWEAQFGDFANGAQIIIDQYISSSEAKWGETSNLVVLLPHGFEGQGPEHSSARIERFLSLAADVNMKISLPTTSSQYYHLLLEVARDTVNKPHIIFTPKSRLRAENGKASLLELKQGRFFPFLEKGDKEGAFLIFTFGKGVYELEERLKKENIHAVIVQIERLYPFQEEELKEILDKYPHISEYIYYQEEPENMGAQPFLKPLLEKMIKKPLQVVSRALSASPATGFKAVHDKEKEALLQRVCELCKKK